MPEISQERIEDIRHAVGQATLSRRDSLQKRLAVVSAVRVKDLDLRSQAELKQATAQLGVEATEINKALQMENDW